MSLLEILCCLSTDSDIQPLHINGLSVLPAPKAAITPLSPLHGQHNGLASSRAFPHLPFPGVVGRLPSAHLQVGISCYHDGEEQGSGQARPRGGAAGRGRRDQRTDLDTAFDGLGQIRDQSARTDMPIVGRV